MAEHGGSEFSGARAPQGATSSGAIDQPQINWGAVVLAALVMVLAVALVPNTILRTGVALAAFLWGIRLSQARPYDTEIENPLLEAARGRSEGLDRRRYGRLRASTEHFLDQVRAMNRLAIDAREGKLTQRHASVQLDRMTESMRDLVVDIRKNAGVPTPVRS